MKKLDLNSQFTRLIILGLIILLTLGAVVIANVFVKETPQEAARKVGYAYVKARLACDRSAVKKLSVEPSNTGLEGICHKDLKLQDGTPISSDWVKVSGEIVKYLPKRGDAEKDAEIATYVPKLSYENKIVPSTLIVQLVKEGGEWKVFSP